VYDDPAHAETGLEAARKYAKVAAAVPHALHMPSHIFTRLAGCGKIEVQRVFLSIAHR
jgi:hypothetical protein